MNKFEQLIKSKKDKLDDLKSIKIIIDNKIDDQDEQNEMDGIEMLTTNDLELVTVQDKEKDEDEEDDTEFHVNLDKAPPTLQNTVLNEKVYLNESINENNRDETEFDLDYISAHDLQQLYESLNLNESNFSLDVLDPKNNCYRKESLYLFGVDELNTNEIFDFFKKFKPVAVEWINDSSCNLVWKNETHAANALLHMSISYEASDPSKESKHRLPPQGSKWRKSIKLAKDKYLIYMRYSKRTDRKIKGAETRSKYYVKYGNPNYGNIKGLISMSKRNEMKTKQLNEATADLSFDDEQDQAASAGGRKLIAYNLDDNVSVSNTLEEFGTNESIKVKVSNVNKDNKFSSKRSKQMGLYSDNIDDNDNHDDDDDDELYMAKKRKSRYEPYSFYKRHSNDDRSKDAKSDNRSRSNNNNNKYENDPNDLRSKLNSFKRSGYR